MTFAACMQDRQRQDKVTIAPFYVFIIIIDETSCAKCLAPFSVPPVENDNKSGATFCETRLLSSAIRSSIAIAREEDGDESSGRLLTL